MTRETNTKKPS